MKAIQDGDLELARYYIHLGVDVNYEHPELLTTPLIEAVQGGQEEMVALLLEHGADPKQRAGFGERTPLEAAKARKQNKIIQLLEARLGPGNSRFNFWQKWLTCANALTLMVGLLVAFAGNSIFFELHNNYTRQVFFGGEMFSAEALAFKNWLFGIIGGTIVGFHSLMIFISENAFKEKKRWAYLALWTGLASWFIIDSGISLYYGAIHNLVLINLVALALIGLPLAATRNEFK